MYKSLSIAALAAITITITACGGTESDADSTTEAPATTEAEAESTEAPKPTEAPAVTEAPAPVATEAPTTLAPTTTIDPVPADAQAAYAAAGLPPLTLDQFNTYTDGCDRLSTDSTYQQVYWTQTDAERAQIIMNISPLCPEVAAVLDSVKPVTANMTPSQEQAYRSAQDYLDVSSFSRLGLIGQLEYEQFSTADATFAVDALTDVDWNEQAAQSARDYLDVSSFSCGSLTDQLEYEQFTPEQAAYGAQQSGIC